MKKMLEDTTRDNTHYDITQLSFGAVHVSANSGDSNKISEDSLRYYEKVLKQSDTLIQKVSLQNMGELIRKVGAYSKLLFFRNVAEVVYKGHRNGKNHLSEIMLATPKAIEIMKNGSYFSPTELITFKHWSEHEKLCNMLPLDYYPDK